MKVIDVHLAADLTADVIPWSYTGNKMHPTQKPVGSLKPLIEAFPKSGDIVLGLFAAPGSTLVAAKERAGASSASSSTRSPSTPSRCGCKAVF